MRKDTIPHLCVDAPGMPARIQQPADMDTRRYALDTAECLEWLQSPARLRDPGGLMRDLPALSLTVGRFVVAVGRITDDAWVVATYHDGALQAQTQPIDSLHNAFGSYLAECAQAGLALGKSLERHCEAFAAIRAGAGEVAP